MIREGGRLFEMRLCSVRAEHSPHAYAMASALSELLLLERVTVRTCCRDEDRRLRGVISKVKADPLLPGAVNGLLVECGFGVVEQRCRYECCYIRPEAAVSDRIRDLVLQALHDRADRFIEYVLKTHGGA